MQSLSCRPARGLISLILAFVVGLSIFTLMNLSAGTSAANAAVDGRMLSYGGWTVGTRQLDSGEFVYCIEPGAITPSGPQLAAVEASELRGYSFFTYNATGWSGVTSAEPISGEPLRRINYVISQYGDTTDPAEAVAVQFAIWWLRDSPGEAVWMEHHAAWVEAHGGSAEIARARALVSEAIQVLNNPPSTDPGSLQLRQGTEHGTGWVDYPAGTTEVRIQGATFDDGSQRTEITGGSAGSLAWRAELHREGWQSSHDVTASGTWESVAATWPARVFIYPSVDPDQQVLSWAVGPIAERRAGEFERVRTRVDSTFEPVFTTRVVQEELTDASDRFADTVILDTAAASSPWPARLLESGSLEYVPLRLHGVLYGPFEHEQEESDRAPDDAPVAARVELLAGEGPGLVEAVAEQLPEADGYYYWVWSIAEADQDQEIRESGVLPSGYRFTDRFGLPDERHSVRLPVPEPAEPAEDEPETPQLAEHTALANTGGTGATAGMLLIGPALLIAGAAGLAIRRMRRTIDRGSAANVQ